MSFWLRVKTLTSSPSRCTWMRAPSSFHSTETSPTTASSIDAAGEASIGCTGDRTCRPILASPSMPSSAAVAATAPRSARSMSARRTAAAGTSKASATASTINAGQGALANLAGEGPAQEVLLGFRGPGEEIVEKRGPVAPVSPLR